MILPKALAYLHTLIPLKDLSTHLKVLVIQLMFIR